MTLGVLTDDSGSMRRLYPVVLEAIRIMSDDLNPEDEVFLSHFTVHLAIDLPPAGASGLRSSLAALAPRGASGQWQTGTNLLRLPGTGARVRREESAHRDKAALLLITDGNDTTSLLTLKQTIAAVGHRRPLIYAIGLPGDDSRSGRSALRKITEASGGQAFFPKYVEQLPAIARRIAREMRSQYTLTYTPETQASDGIYRALVVKVDTPPNSPPLLVRRGPATTLLPHNLVSNVLVGDQPDARGARADHDLIGGRKPLHSGAAKTFQHGVQARRRTEELRCRLNSRRAASGQHHRPFGFPG